MKVKLLLFCFYKCNLRRSALFYYAKYIYLDIQPDSLWIHFYNACLLKIDIKRASMRVDCLNMSPFILIFKIFSKPRAHRLI